MLTLGILQNQTRKYAMLSIVNIVWLQEKSIYINRLNHFLAMPSIFNLNSYKKYAEN
jgi:hypothetical protein